MDGIRLLVFLLDIVKILKQSGMEDGPGTSAGERLIVASRHTRRTLNLLNPTRSLVQIVAVSYIQQSM